MIYRCTFREIDGVRYLAGYRLVSERGTPTADDELPRAPGPVLTEDGRFRFRVVDNPDFGKDGDTRRFMLQGNPQPKPAADVESDTRAAKRAAIANALPGILLAVSEGKDLAEAVREVLAGSKEA